MTLPSFTSYTGFSGSLITGVSLITSVILLALAADMLTITNIIDSIIRDISMFMQ